MARMKSTPWTPEQVDSLNAYQRAGIFHTYTCGTCRNDLIATTDGWRCECGYTQDWAADFLLDGSWKAFAIPGLHKID